jgi:hypothetical protein
MAIQEHLDGLLLELLRVSFTRRSSDGPCDFALFARHRTVLPVP